MHILNSVVLYSLQQTPPNQFVCCVGRHLAWGGVNSSAHQGGALHVNVPRFLAPISCFSHDMLALSGKPHQEHVHD